MPTEAMARELVDDHGDLLRDAAGDVYDARAAFLREGFDGYVADTVYVRETGTYQYWPRKAPDGLYLGFDEPVAAERDALDRVTDEGFVHVGSGAARHVLVAPPPYEEFVVKLGRAGTNSVFGEGPTQNLRERRYTVEYGDTAPIVPCHYTSTHGEYAVADRVEGPTLADRPDEEALATLRTRLVETVPEHEPPVLPDPGNAMWDGDRPVVVDYTHHAVGTITGVPCHVDGDRVRDRVEDRRRRGEKRDLAVGGGWVDPEFGPDDE